MTAIGIIVSVAVLESVASVGPRAAISGFATTATITIVATHEPALAASAMVARRSSGPR